MPKRLLKGSFEIRPSGNGVELVGKRESGQKVKISLDNRQEADDLASKLFPKKDDKLDDWGLPLKVTPETASAVNTASGVQTTQTDTKSDPEKEKRKVKTAKSLADMGGVLWATGTIAAGRRILTARGKELVNPDQGQVKDLRESFKDMVTDWFGDKEVKPWQMVILLTLGIPMSMYIQAPKKKPELKSVP